MSYIPELITVDRGMRNVNLPEVQPYTDLFHSILKVGERGDFSMDIQDIF